MLLTYIWVKLILSTNTKKKKKRERRIKNDCNSIKYLKKLEKLTKPYTGINNIFCETGK